MSEWFWGHLGWVAGAAVAGIIALVLALAWHQAQEDAHMVALGYHQVCVNTGEMTYTTTCTGGKFNTCITTARPVMRCTWER